jgi:elongation factor G
MTGGKAAGPRNVALVGPYLSGKTTLLETILFITGAITRRGSIADGNTVGDSSQEARERQMGVELNVAGTTFLDSQFTFLDCPGSIEFLQETFDALMGADVAVVVCEADADKARTLSPLLKFLDDHRIPRFVFVNKVDRSTPNLQVMIDALQSVSASPMVLRHIPIFEGEAVAGYVDLAGERAYRYKDGAASERIDVPDAAADDRDTARYEMLEKLADFDDDLMEKVLEDIEPEKDEVFDQLTKDLQEGLITPVLLGAAEHEYGVRRLLKALRHEAPDSSRAAERLGVSGDGEPLAQALKTYHTQRGGKLSVARVWRGPIKDGATLNGERVSGIFRLMGHQTEKLAEALAGDVVAFGRLEEARTGDTLSTAKGAEDLPRPDMLPAVFHLAISAADRSDEVKLSGAIAKVVEEDPSLSFEQSQDTQQMLIWGQGEIHLRVAFDRLKNKYGLNVETDLPKVPYKEAIRKPITQRGRHKRQTGGHGQFGDVVLDIKPLPRGTGFEFHDTIAGGVVPKQYIPAVEAGVKEYLVNGPLGFPVVDLSVTLTDGSYHTVDSSELAFKTAGRIAMSEGLPQCNPVLLEPILHVAISVPNEFTPKINSVITTRRGQILGFDAREGWEGWDTISAHMPQSEIHNLIVELRSLTLGVGTYTWRYDHLQELTGRLADDVLAQSAAD